VSRRFEVRAGYVNSSEFLRRFRIYIILAWVIPPGIGVAFLVFIELFTPEHVAALLHQPLLLVCVAGFVALTTRYFRRFVDPVARWLDDPEHADAERALDRLRRFPGRYWALLVGYLLLVQSTIMLVAPDIGSAWSHPIAWFRSYMAVVIASIIVGLPIFFRILDLFGDVCGGLPLTRPQVSIRVKVFLIGALVPLLIDTMLIQYFWTRTGFFNAETIAIWFALETLALAGAVVFVRSFGQALIPLEGLLGGGPGDAGARLQARSTDEIGVLARRYESLFRQLRESESNLRSIAENANDGILVHVNGRLVYANRRLAMLVGYDMEELLQRSITDLLRPDEIPKIEARYRSRLRGEPVPDQYESVALRRDGREVQIELTAALAQWHGRPAIIVVIRDITQRQHAAEALRRSEERFRKVFHATPAIISISTVDEGRFIDVNESFLRAIGRPRDEVVGHSVHELGIWPVPAQREKIVAQVRRDGSVREVELVFARQNGERRHMLGSMEQIPIGDDLCLLAVFQDITERKRVEEELAREKERAQVTLASIGDGVITTDVAGRVDYLNPVAEQLTGWSLAEARGRPVTEVFCIVAERTREPAEDPVARCLREGRISGLTDNTVLIRRDDREYAIEDSAAPIRGADGGLAGVVFAFRDVSHTRALAQQIAYQATHDSLTGLINRREFEIRLEAALSQAREEGATHALCYLDLDQFKVVNDTCGHVAGDEMLRQLASQLQAHMREHDTLARLGGDEFGVLLRHCTLAQARDVADGLRRVVRNFRFVWNGSAYEVGVSIGLVPVVAGSGSLTDVLSAADSACYVAKDQGRNRCHVFEPNDKVLAQRHGEMQWVARIGRALENGKLELYCQPIQPLTETGADERLCEFLLRMRSDDGSVVPPMAFLPAGERYNLMPAIDRWVLRRALAVLNGGNSEFHRGRFDCAMINLSGQSLSDSRFLDFVASEISRPDVETHRLCFEITETAAIANLANVSRFIAVLRGMGCRFALDDFGSGLSSFIYLKNLPVNYLKIAGDFVEHMADDPIDEAMVESINQVGHVLGIRTIAESVETESAVERLRRIGVDFVQGNFVGRPVPLEAKPE
jgi:diguanylate cyclase (GGDEF)-like protein/PAS domain S-box-containing protein